MFPGTEENTSQKPGLEKVLFFSLFFSLFPDWKKTGIRFRLEKGKKMAVREAGVSRGPIQGPLKLLNTIECTVMYWGGLQGGLNGAPLMPRDASL